MNRRKFLAVSGGLSTALAGCLGTASSCRSGRRRIDGEWTVERGPLGGFSLTLPTGSVDRGGQLTARLRNVTDGTHYTGNRFKYDVQRQAEAGWRSLFHVPETSYWTAEAIGHEPGTGFTWDLTVTRDGLERTEEGQPEYFVCEPLETGRYRFLYWGISSAQDGGGQTRALGANFRVTEQ